MAGKRLGHPLGNAAKVDHGFRIGAPTDAQIDGPVGWLTPRPPSAVKHIVVTKM
jgi:hypothetical protein